MSLFNIIGVIKFELGNIDENGGITTLNNYFEIKQGSLDFDNEEFFIIN